MDKEITSRKAPLLSQLGSSIFSEVASWKREAVAQGIDVIDLGIGSPDRAPSLKVRQALSQFTLQEDMYAYPALKSGLPFREKAAEWMKHRFGVTLDATEEICTIAGSQDGLAHLAMAIAPRGSIAIVPDPGYPIYTASLALAGVEPYFIPLVEEHQYLPQLESIPQEVWDRASFILLNYPNNPITAVASLDFYESLIDFAKKHNVLVVHDLAYSEMGYDGFMAPSILQIDGAKDIAVEFHSLSKSFNMAGCRIGFMVGNADVVSALTELKSNIDYGVFDPVQEAGIVALDEAMYSDDFVRSGEVYQRRRDHFIRTLHEGGWGVTSPQATMFVWAKLPPLANGDFSTESWSSRRFAKQLLADTGVVVIPGDAFGIQGEGYVRIALVENEERLVEAAIRLGQFIHQNRCV
ncbi:aminotransferase class I/II-fold pyridoxal phosphate-dependent enzyme [Paenibacillus endoradicis]|uniref:aminotransferase class I/II-fold pyridoxal phosphate-dependent enzyme n=1 Tax=Paenibacillus endoradicis TaxID=2972487 RepID=UPI002159A6A4|nr:aminotransferase class I/II-fold pyridoxal phosphate-dependent enzyme [Paenibacillus endoradicis]MCR8657937.1 aminotransferase class I/II-fold pyridoxal phosphate-dependent enzyme [Paenibacillus endoradicis]